MGYLLEQVHVRSFDSQLLPAQKRILRDLDRLAAAPRKLLMKLVGDGFLSRPNPVLIEHDRSSFRCPCDCTTNTAQSVPSGCRTFPRRRSTDLDDLGLSYGL